MKNLVKIIFLALLPFYFGCSDDDALTEVSGTGAPTGLSMDFKITQDNSGLVTITPSGENATQFQVEFGDGEISEEIAPGQSLEHIYAEGSYEVKLMAVNLSGERAEVIQNLEVSFQAPQNLEVSIVKDANNPFIVNVSATADFETYFDVYFGEDANEEPVSILEGETATHQYQETGTYNITVIAYSGGTQTTTFQQEIQIFFPLALPITFENPQVDYTFFNFGGGDGDGVPIVNNPAPNSVNSSSRVGQYTKIAGSESWAGTVAVLNEDIDFSGSNLLSVDVYSPQAGIPVLLKVENETDANIFAEAVTNTTLSNQWERLVFEMPVDAAQTYGKVVLFFNFNIPGTGETYYFDNIQKVPMSLPLDFEIFDPSAYIFSGFGGGNITVEGNPFADANNPSTHVGKFNKGVNAETWAGAFIELDEAVDFSQGSKIRLKVRSPQAGIQVLVKFEDPTDAAQFVEASATVNQADTWETVEADFTGMNLGNWKRLVLFFDFGNPGVGTDYYFDDVEQTN